MEESAWEFNQWCEYSGTPDDCVEPDPKAVICWQRYIPTVFSEFHWKLWPVYFEVSAESPLLWRKFIVRDCLDGGGNKVMPSNCRGCHKYTPESVLWVFDDRIWSEALTYCQQQNGTLFGQFGDTVKALMNKYLALTAVLKRSIP